MRLLQRVALGDLRLCRRLLLWGHRNGLAAQATQAGFMACRKRRGDDPFPALGADRRSLALQFLDGQLVEQANILQPAAAILSEEVVEHDAAGLVIGVEADEDRAGVAGANRVLRQRLPDMVRFAAVGL